MPKLKYILGNNENHFVRNYIMRKTKESTVQKIPGTAAYNQEALVNKITWVERYYGRNPDNTFTKKAFCAAGTGIYMGDDVAGTLSEVHTGLTNNTRPESVVMQVSGNSRMYFFNGYDSPIYYEGNDAGTWTDSSMTPTPVQGVVHGERLWVFERNSSILSFSAVLDPEDFGATEGGEIRIGNDRDSFIRRLAVLGDYLYIFKNDSIWRLSGKTRSTFKVIELVPETGLLAQKALAVVGPVMIMVAQQDKQIYQFNGTWDMKPLTAQQAQLDFESVIDPTKTDDMACIWDRRNNLFRISYKGVQSDETYNNYESIFPLGEQGQDGFPRWSHTRGARVSVYSMWDRQGDFTLVSGRSDTGKIMYHNRGSSWDTEGIETILRTDRIMHKDGYNSQWNSIYLKGTPSNGSVTIRGYLDDRITGESDRSSQTLSDLGEQDTLESIAWKTQAHFHNWIPLPAGFNIGETFSIEIYDNTKGKEINLDYIILDATQRSQIKSMLVGGS